MKMTMHIDEDVLDRVMKVTGAKTKTEAVQIALTEMARRHKLKELFSQGLGMTPEQLKAEFAPTAADEFDRPLLNVAEPKTPYGESGSAR
ncbi:type II toxin-antitoxin system VapB family antitoxin [Oleiharenicola lentus]|jgi:Arc/MetJ family transcription regulator|uniref:Type II toxin-antitoxin system VapB family antitoxin n=2 Tax=Oleiharenicola lentus TaxID=2508720 RepID=A0A4Q1C845_9BACT|nr:type II toxin-antitoxin system VapB family antitoxin [Oleiharenicola lentus]